jgi:hypothetical protein
MVPDHDDLWKNPSANSGIPKTGEIFLNHSNRYGIYYKVQAVIVNLSFNVRKHIPIAKKI